MVRKIIMDVDPGIDDAIALSIALYDPEVEVIGLTSVGGNASAAVTARNLQGIVEFLDPAKLPRIGVGEDSDELVTLPDPLLFGKDGLGGFVLPIAPRCNPASAQKVICDLVRSNPNEVSILTLGPLTNLARAFQRDPEIACLIDRVFIAGGTYEAPGNITPCTEFNIAADPKSARFVFKSPCTKIMIPLDVTSRVRFSMEILARLPSEKSKFGAFLHHQFKTCFRAWRQYFGKEQIHLQAVAAYFALTRPCFFESIESACDIETEGFLTNGATVFDRRIPPIWRRNIEVLTQVDPLPIEKLTIDKLNQTDLMFSRLKD